MRKLIRVTAADIRTGQKSSITKCPIARAISRVCGRVTVPVGYSSVNLGFDHLIDLPKCVQIFIHSFDAGNCVEPFNFYLSY